MRRFRFLMVGAVATMALATATPAFASGGVNSGGVNSGGGGGGSTSTGTTLVTSPCATVSASSSVLNQGGVTSIRVTGTVNSCSDVDETLYVQIQDQSGRLWGAQLTPPNTAGGSCYICDSVLAARKSWSFSYQWGIPADGWTYPFAVTVLHRDSMDVTPIVLASTTTSVTAPTTRNS